MNLFSELYHSWGDKKAALEASYMGADLALSFSIYVTLGQPT